MKLYEISDEIERVMAEAIDRETGEIAEGAAELLDSLQMDLKDKALAVAKYAHGELAEAAAIKERAKQNLARAERHERHASWLLESYLAEYLTKHDMGPREPAKAGRETILKDLDVEIGFTKSASAVPNHPALNNEAPPGTPRSYITEVTVEKVDKARIRKDLLAKQKVQGWQLRWKSALKIK
jgi:hypothetical protein